MRQRKIKNLQEKLAAREAWQVRDPAEHKGKWAGLFGRRAPLYIEIGCGKGQFISEMSRKYSDADYVAFEGQESVVLHALEKAEAADSRNLLVVPQYVHELAEIFAEGEVSGIYLNFSDPWPKDRHAKRRLTSGGYLSDYAKILAEDGFLEFKTDNDGLFEYSVEQMEAEPGFVTEYVTRDLHRDVPEEEIVTTEYEDKFSAQGKNINYIRLRKR